MEFFLDSADLSEIKRWLDYGVVDGVTTNPSIMYKGGGYDMEVRAKEIAELVEGRPVSVEVFSNDLDEMLEQARTIASWSSNIVVKIPIVNEEGVPCLGVVRTLVSEGIRVNVTAMMALGQVIMATKAGATYASIFAGRVSDEGHDAPKLIGQAAEWLDRWAYPTKIIVGSIREAINIQDAAVAGAHIITVPPEFMAKFVDHHFSRATVRAFNTDGRKALAMMEERTVQIHG